MSNGDYNSKSKTSRSVRQETVDHVQADNVHGKESVSHEQTEAAAVSVSEDQAYSDASHLHKVRSFFPLYYTYIYIVCI